MMLMSSKEGGCIEGVVKVDETLDEKGKRAGKGGAPRGHHMSFVGRCIRSRRWEVGH